MPEFMNSRDKTVNKAPRQCKVSGCHKKIKDKRNVRSKNNSGNYFVSAKKSNASELFFNIKYFASVYQNNTYPVKICGKRRRGIFKLF